MISKEIGIKDNKNTKERKDDQEMDLLKIALSTSIFYLKYGKIKRSYMMLT